MPPTRSHQRTADAATALTTVKELSRVVRGLWRGGQWTADGRGPRHVLSYRVIRNSWPAAVFGILIYLK